MKQRCFVQLAAGHADGSTSLFDVETGEGVLNSTAALAAPRHSAPLTQVRSQKRKNKN